MTLPYSPSIASFTGNGLVKEFPFNFKVWDSSQLVVSVSGPNGIVEYINFTAELGENGGTVTALYNNAPVPQGYTLSIVRNMPFEQDVDLVSGTRFDPQVIEDQLDKAAAERQQLREGLERAVIVAPGSDDTPMMIVGKIFAARDTAVSSASGAAQSAADAAETLDKTIVEHITALEEIHTAKTAAVAEVDTHGKEQQDLCTEQMLLATEQAVQASASAESAAESAKKVAEIADKGQPTATQDIQGIVKLSDSISSASSVNGGISATPKAVNDVKILADTAQDTASTAKNAADKAQSTADTAKALAEQLKNESIDGTKDMSAKSYRAVSGDSQTNTGFKLADSRDIGELFGKLDNVENATTGSGTFVTGVTVSVNGKNVKLTQTKGTPGYCSYCGYCGYCSYCTYVPPPNSNCNCSGGCN